jgi:hypothetical protein
MNPNAGKYFPKNGERHPNVIEHERVAKLLIEAGYLAWQSDEDADGDYVLTLPAKRSRAKIVLPKTICYSVEWGYELHSVNIQPRTWATILAGEEVALRSRGWYEGTSFPVRWHFNYGEAHSLCVTYGDDGGTGYEGDVTDGYICEES